MVRLRSKRTVRTMGDNKQSKRYFRKWVTSPQLQYLEDVRRGDICRVPLPGHWTDSRGLGDSRLAATDAVAQIIEMVQLDGRRDFCSLRSFQTISLQPEFRSCTSSKSKWTKHLQAFHWSSPCHKSTTAWSLLGKYDTQSFISMSSGPSWAAAIGGVKWIVMVMAADTYYTQ